MVSMINEARQHAKNMGVEDLLEDMLDNNSKKIKKLDPYIIPTTKIICPKCKNTFKTKRRNNTCRKCNYYFSYKET